MILIEKHSIWRFQNKCINEIKTRTDHFLPELRDSVTCQDFRLVQADVYKYLVLTSLKPSLKSQKQLFTWILVVS